MKAAASILALTLAAAALPAQGQPRKPGMRTGEEIYTVTCAACHKEGVANAPKLGDRGRWAPLIKEGLKELTTDAIKGKGAMPPKGGDPTLTREEVSRAIVHMANRSGAKWKERK